MSRCIGCSAEKVQSAVSSLILKAKDGKALKKHKQISVLKIKQNTYEALLEFKVYLHTSGKVSYS
jgi:hypothetical protein